MAVGFGGAMALANFLSYCHLVLGAFIVLYSISHLARHGRTGWRQFLLCASLGLGTVVLIYAILWLGTGFDPIATFWAAVRNQAELLRTHIGDNPRHWPGTILPDLQDFLLGSGWISVLILIFWLLRKDRGPTRGIVWIGLAQVIIVALTSLLPGETARVLMFLQPLMMLPLGMELARWGTWQRTAAYLLLWFITCAQGHQMAFIRGKLITQTLIVPGV